MRKFHFASICNVLPCELRLFWYSTGVLNRHLANKLPTCCQQSADSRPTNGQQSADCWQKIFVKGRKRQSADSWPTIGQQLGDCWSTVGRLLANCGPTVQQLADSFLGELFFTFSLRWKVLCLGLSASLKECTQIIVSKMWPKRFILWKS